LGLGKILLGLASRSQVVFSDGIHSFSDVASTFVALIALKVSGKEADSEHPYGHEKFEPVFAKILSTILILTGVLLALKNIRILTDNSYTATSGAAVFVITIISIVTKEGMYWYTIRKARKMKSLTMETDAWHHRADAFSSIAALLGLILARKGWAFMDPLAAIVVSIMIIRIGVLYYYRSINLLVDHAVDKQTLDRIRKSAESVPGVMAVKEIKSRLSGNRSYVDIVIVVDGNLTVFRGHEIASKVHDNIERDVEDCKHCLVHVDPG
jgi:cation diffusion facilitator family transporter